MSRVRTPRRRSAPIRIAFSMLRIGIVLTFGWWGILYFNQTRMLFPGASMSRAGEARPPHGGEVWTKRLASGDVEAWFVPAVKASDARPAPLVVAFHGNAELIDHQAETVDLFRRRGFAVLLPEYRGYGRSAGEPSEEGLRDDAAEFLRRALARPDIDDARFVLFGRSLGCGVAVDLAGACADRGLPKPSAIILVSAFYSVVRLAHERWAPGFLVKNPYRSDLTLPKLGVPTLILHGNCDTVIPHEHGKDLHALVPGSQWVEFDCDHNDFPGANNGARYEQAAAEFLSRNGLRP
jgi:pimeloyl-ACP methyl ester carboxylesterase